MAPATFRVIKSQKWLTFPYRFLVLNQKLSFEALEMSFVTLKMSF
jgi:hypothetical protein